MKIKLLLPLFLLLLMSCGLGGTHKVTKDKSYVLTNDKSELIFMVNEIAYDIDEIYSEERIDYILYNPKKSSPTTRTSYIKHKRTKQKNNSILLERIDGSQSIQEEGVSFTWSFGSENYIYLYLEDSCSIKELK